MDFSGGLQDAWLTPAPFLNAPPKTSVMVSAYDQIDFFKQIYRGTLPVSQEARSLTRRVMSSEKSPKGFVLTGKTGSGFVGEKSDLRLGWYVAHLKKGDQEFVSVVTFTDRTPIRKPGFGGLLAKDAMKALLAERGYW
jgi:beta-lactamase class D